VQLAERLSARTLLLGGVMIVILALFISGIQDPDFWWHLRIGRWMVEMMGEDDERVAKWDQLVRDFGGT